MGITGKLIDGQGWCALDEETGDYLCEVTKEIDKYPGRPELLYFRLHRGEDKQLISIREMPIYPESKEDRLKWVFNPPSVLEEKKFGVELHMQPSWGSYFPIDELDHFMQRLFEFIFIWYSNRQTPFITLTFKHKNTGREYRFSRKNTNFKDAS